MTYEQYGVPEPMIGDFVLYLRANDTYQVLIHGDEAVGIRFPKKVRLLVTESDEGAKGNTATGATKTVKVETGAVVTVPLFIKQGDTIAVDPETNTYLERA
jgi:elongation factor P